MLIFIRHGQTDLNKLNVLQGRSDYPLNEKGIQEAQKAHEFINELGIRIDRIISSPARRARQTGEIVAPGIRVETDDRLLEMDYGPYEGVSLGNIPDELMAFFNDLVNVPAPEGIEPLADVVKRAGSFLEDHKDEVSKENILVCTHAVALKGYLEYLDPESKGSWWDKYIGNCDIFITDVVNGQYVPFIRKDINKKPM